MGSALEAVTDYVYTLLGEDKELGVAVLWGPPTGDDRPAELIAVGAGPEGESGTSEREWTVLGPQPAPLDEEFKIDLVVEVLAGNSGVDLKAAYERSVEIAEEVETLIRQDPELGVLNVRNGKFGRWQGRYFRSETGNGHRFFLSLSGIARI